MKKINIILGLGALIILVAGYSVFEYSSKKVTSANALEAAGLSNTSTTTATPIIVLDICSLRRDHLSGYGYNRNTSPNLDAFMKESDAFDNYWTESGFCLPNFSTLFTGTRPEVHNMLLDKTGSSKLSPKFETLAEILKQGGYTTAAFVGSRFLLPSTDKDSSGLDRGFDVFNNSFMPTRDAQHMQEGSFEDNLPTVKNWLSTNRSNPFFLYVTIDDLHSPYRTDNDKTFFPNYKGILDTVVPDMTFDRAYNKEDLSIVSSLNLPAAIKEFNSSPDNMKYLIAKYDAAIQRTDRLTGEFLDALKKDGLYDKSLIIITVHQGEQLGEHNLLGHTQGLYEPILGVPLFIKYPGQTTAHRFSQLTERIDLPATILDEVGVLANHQQFTGKSLLPLLKDPSAVWEKPYIFASSKPTKWPINNNKLVEERAVRDNQYKLIWFGYKAQPYELYDLKADPSEKQNLVSTSPDVFNRLKTALDNYIAANPQ